MSGQSNHRDTHLGCDHQHFYHQIYINFRSEWIIGLMPHIHFSVCFKKLNKVFKNVSTSISLKISHWLYDFTKLSQNSSAKSGVNISLWSKSSTYKLDRGKYFVQITHFILQITEYTLHSPKYTGHSAYHIEHST